MNEPVSVQEFEAFTRQIAKSHSAFSDAIGALAERVEAANAACRKIDAAAAQADLKLQGTLAALSAVVELTANESSDIRSGQLGDAFARCRAQYQFLLQDPHFKTGFDLVQDRFLPTQA